MLLLLRGATHGDVVGESHQVGQKHEERGVVTLTAASFFIHKSRGLSSLTCFFQEPSLRVLHCHSWDKDILNHIAHVYIHARCIFSKRYIHISFMEAHSMGDTFACCIVSCTYVHRTEAIPWHPWHPLQQLWGFAMPIQVDANNFSVVLLVFFVKLGYQTIKNLGGNQHLLFKLRYPPPPKVKQLANRKGSSSNHHSSGAMLWNFGGVHPSQPSAPTPPTGVAVFHGGGRRFRTGCYQCCRTVPPGVLGFIGRNGETWEIQKNLGGSDMCRNELVRMKP